MIVLQGISLGLDSAEILKNSGGIIDKATKILKENPGIKVRIEGHTCGIGSDEYNLKLSRKRALAVKNYLISKGIPAERMQTAGKGEKFPVSSNETAEGRKQNRRVEFIVIEKSKF